MSTYTYTIPRSLTDVLAKFTGNINAFESFYFHPATGTLSMHGYYININTGRCHRAISASITLPTTDLPATDLLYAVGMHGFDLADAERIDFDADTETFTATVGVLSFHFTAQPHIVTPDTPTHAPERLHEYANTTPLASFDVRKNREVIAMGASALAQFKKEATILNGFNIRFDSNNTDARLSATDRYRIGVGTLTATHAPTATGSYTLDDDLSRYLLHESATTLDVYEHHARLTLDAGDNQHIQLTIPHRLEEYPKLAGLVAGLPDTGQVQFSLQATDELITELQRITKNAPRHEDGVYPLEIAPSVGTLTQRTPTSSRTMRTTALNATGTESPIFSVTGEYLLDILKAVPSGSTVSCVSASPTKPVLMTVNEVDMRYALMPTRNIA